MVGIVIVIFSMVWILNDHHKSNVGEIEAFGILVRGSGRVILIGVGLAIIFISLVLAYGASGPKPDTGTLPDIKNTSEAGNQEKGGESIEKNSSKNAKDCGRNSISAKFDVGWAFLGWRIGGDWQQRYFSVIGGRDIPGVGDAVLVSKPVNLRRDYIRYINGEWKNAESVKELKVGSKYMVSELIEVDPGYFWIRISDSIIIYRKGVGCL
jgi:hypothetical protein